MSDTFLFNGTITVRQLSATSYEELDLLGRHVRYMRAEHVEVMPTLLEQRLKPAKPAAYWPDGEVEKATRMVMDA